MKHINEYFTTEDEKGALLRGLYLVESSDNKLSDQEGERLSNAVAVLRASDDMINRAKEYVGNHSFQENLKSITFSSKIQIIVFLLEAGRMAFLDGEYVPAEQKVNHSIAEYNKISPEIMEKLEAEILREHEFFLKQEELINTCL